MKAPLGIATAILLVQAALFYSASHGDAKPLSAPLIAFPQNLGSFHLQQEGFVDKETLDVLKADDTLTRWYTGPDGGASLFIAYFQTQRTGQSPHSPKNCLPGSGWEPEATGFLEVPVAGQPQPIRINRYVVSHGDEKSVVLYWYQSPRRVIASELSAKFWLVMDSIRYHRSDTALVRVTAPVLQNDVPGATRAGVAFVASVFPVLRSYLPE